MTGASGVGTLLDTRHAAGYDATNRVRRFLNQAHVKVAPPGPCARKISVAC